MGIKDLEKSEDEKKKLVEKTAALQDMLKQKTLELSDAAKHIEELEESSKDNQVLDEIKEKYQNEIGSYKEKISELQSIIDEKSADLTSAMETLELTKANHSHEMESYTQEKNSLLQDTLKELKEKSSELDEATKN